MKNVVRKRGLAVKFARSSDTKSAIIHEGYLGSNCGAVVRAHGGPGSKPYVALVCFRSFVSSKKFFSVRFFPLLKRKQHLKTPIRPRMVEEESLSGSATSKSLFIFYLFYFISIFLFLLGIATLYCSTLKLTSNKTRYLAILLQVRNRKLKKELTREKRNAREQQEHLQQQVPSRAAFSIIAASSAEELATILQNERKGQVKIMSPLENDKETGAS